MIGSLTIEKANYNISYMAASLLVLSRAGGRLSRAGFVSQMATLMGCSATTADGKENRVPYNKTKFDRYFGFIDVDPATKDLIITPRGTRAVEYIEEDPNKVDLDKRYDFKPSCRVALRELFLDSICFDTFGSYNCGAEESNSDIEPPKVVLRLLRDIGSCSKKEIGYVLWGLDAGAFSSWTDATQHVIDNRNDPSFDYDVVLDNWGRSNFVDDFKLLDLLAYDKWQIVEKDLTSGRYALARDLSTECLARIDMLSPFVQPLRIFLEGSAYSTAQTHAWIRNSVLGRVGRDELIVTCDVASESSSQIESKLAKAIALALKLRRHGVFADNEVKKTHCNSVVTFYLLNVSSRQNLDGILASIEKSSTCKNSFKDADHGWSQNCSVAPHIYNELVLSVPSASYFGMNNIRLPANINFIGVK